MYTYAYSYTVLRYVHDPVTGEFVNVGVALFSPTGKFVGVRCRRARGRLARTFPGINAAAFRSAVVHIESHFKRIARGMDSQLQLEGATNVLTFARSALPTDDSSLQWSPFGSGVTKDPVSTLEQLFERMVTRYEEEAPAQKKTDHDVWRSVRTELERRNILEFFAPKVIEVDDDTVEFDHAWKNGKWHCLDAVSFDLSTESHIKDKAHKWLGQMTSVQAAPEPFKLYLLLGEPSAPELQTAFEDAMSILRKIPVENELYVERDVARLSKRLEDEVRDHQRMN